jgi:ribosomal protein S16
MANLKGMKKLLYFIFLLSIFAWASCTHEVIGPIVPPSNTPTDTIQPPPPLESDCDSDSIYYANTIAPLLMSSCGSSVVYCHNGPSDENDGIDLSSWASIYYSNEDLVVPGDPNDSKIIDVINDGEMPPDTSSYSISNDQRDIIAAWIQQGAQNNSCNEGCDTSNVTFQDDIFPIVSLYCTSCHSGANPDGGVLLTNYSTISSEAVNGSMLDAINWIGTVEPMPYQSDQLPECYINLIQIWVDNGAQDN